MSLPHKVAGAGNQNSRYAFKVTFSSALSAIPAIEAWDNSQEYPAVDAYGSSTLKEIFTGTVGNGSKPMLYAVDTTTAAPGSGWKPTNSATGGANPNRLKGETNYCAGSSIPSGNMYFNLGLEVPSDASVLSEDSMNFLLQVRYRYSGAAPTVKFHCNTGTEAIPVWEEVVGGTNGIQFADLNTDWTGTPVMTLPESGTSDAMECGVN